MIRKCFTTIAVLALMVGCNLEEETYDDWDIDLSGDVSRDEFYERFYESGYWNLWDRDGSGKIDEEEWKMGLDEYYEDFDYDHYSYSDFDVDHDGIVDEEELADGTFVIWDEDGDGNIDKAEFRRNAFPTNN